MKLGTFARAVAPHGVGDVRLLPDEVAERLQAEGVLSSAEPWPPGAPVAAPRAPEHPQRRILKPVRPSGAPDVRKVK